MFSRAMRPPGPSRQDQDARREEGVERGSRPRPPALCSVRNISVRNISVRNGRMLALAPRRLPVNRRLLSGPVIGAGVVLVVVAWLGLPKTVTVLSVLITVLYL